MPTQRAAGHSCPEALVGPALDAPGDEQAPAGWLSSARKAQASVVALVEKDGMLGGWLLGGKHP